MPTSTTSQIFAPFEWGPNGLACDSHALEPIAGAHGTPLYVYSARGIIDRLNAFKEAFASLRPSIHAAVKACPNLSVLRTLVDAGVGLDVVSGGEFERAWLAGCAPDRIVFAGVGKSDDEINAALTGTRSPLLGSGLAPDDQIRARGPVGLFNIESVDELDRIGAAARSLGIVANAALRVNPDVDARTHEYTTTGKKENKFGIDLALAESVFAANDPVRSGVRLHGLHAHIGSPVHELGPYEAAATALVDAAQRIRAGGREITLLNLGGGWSVPYDADAPERPLGSYAERLAPILKPELDRGTRLLLEPGRSIVANAGVLLTRVISVKQGRTKRFVVLDAGMHTLLRPSLYRAEHFAWPVHERPDTCQIHTSAPGLTAADLVGPICETGDFIATDRAFPEVAPGDLVAVFSAGAYGMSMASTYNDHPRPAEVLIHHDGHAEVVRRRESVADLLIPEVTPASG